MKMEFSLIDQLGAVKAQIAELEVQAKELIEGVKQQILASGQPTLEGVLFRATLTATVRASIDAKLLRADFPEAAKACTRESSVETLRVSARS